jgi:hypothetical protein
MVQSFLFSRRKAMVEYTNPAPNTPRNRGDYEAPHVSPVTPAEDIRTVMINRVSWGAVFSGVAMAMVVQFILNLLGVGLGVTALDYGTAVSSLSMGAISWWIVSGIIAAGIGGFTAGRLAGGTRESTCAWHGLTSWAASVVLITMLVIAGASALVGGALNVTGIGGTISIRNGMPPNANGPAASITNTPAAPAPDGTTEMTNTNTTPNMTIDAATLSHGALVCTLALVLGGVAAWLGGWFGMVQPTVTPNSWERGRLH